MKMNSAFRQNNTNTMTFLAIISIMFFIQVGNCEMYTALADMEELLETEAVLISNLETYILAQEEKLKFLRM